MYILRLHYWLGNKSNSVDCECVHSITTESVNNHYREPLVQLVANEYLVKCCAGMLLYNNIGLLSAHCAPPLASWTSHILVSCSVSYILPSL